MFSPQAYAESKEPDEIFVGGVFDQGRRVTPEQLARSAEAPKPVRPAAFFKEPEVDETGAASQILMIFDAASSAGEISAQVVKLSGCKTVTQCERALLEMVNAQKDEALLSLLGRPTGARFLAEDYRMTDDERAQLEPKDPGLALQKCIILRFNTVKDARAALKQIESRREISEAALDQTMSYSSGWQWTGGIDPYMIQQFDPKTFQWGMNAMKFPQAWNLTPGNAYLGAADGGVPLASETPQYFGYCWTGLNNVYSFHCDLAENFRPQFSLAPGTYDPERVFHGTHVTGIMAARGDNGIGVSGGCPWCSVAMGRANGPSGPLGSNAAISILGLVDRGMQAVNISANAFELNDIPIGWRGSMRCGDSAATSYFPLCYSIAYAAARDVNVVASSGNHRWTRRYDDNDTFAQVPSFPATNPLLLSVGGIQSNGWMWRHGAMEDPSTISPDVPVWTNIGPPPFFSSAFAGKYGVVAPAVSVISTVPRAGFSYSAEAYSKCGDTATTDESLMLNDKYGTCTGTSMAAPHVTALVGLIRSANPLLSRWEVETIITNSGNVVRVNDNPPNPALATPERGSGIPDAAFAVTSAVATNPSRLTPLFSFYSPARLDHFYTTVPQMAGAAIRGTLRPALESAVGAASAYYPVGTGLWGVPDFPSLCCGIGTPLAQAWIFTTPTNPIIMWQPLSPLFRLSWKCGDGGHWPSICTVTPAHTDTAYTSDPLGVAAFSSVGYSLDGVEGYIYPKYVSQPYGTVRLLRKYNPTRDDHAIFPEISSVTSAMFNQGYTVNSGSDWLGWVYPNYGWKPTVQ